MRIPKANKIMLHLESQTHPLLSKVRQGPRPANCALHDPRRGEIKEAQLMRKRQQGAKRRASFKFDHIPKIMLSRLKILPWPSISNKTKDLSQQHIITLSIISPNLLSSDLCRVDHLSRSVPHHNHLTLLSVSRLTPLSSHQGILRISLSLYV